uniref:Reverse transcriptase domain-containing protein n=1 Tax=Romanomermis culicivorax TaxID=13658 RepID=A0A915JW31_ROMCU
MITHDIWEQVTTSSAWALNLVTVPKPDGRIRITTDFSPPNNFVVPEHHPLPRINNLYMQLQGPRMFTKLDLSKGYFHILLAPESCPLTSTIKPYDLFQYKRLPMGLMDAASVFQPLVLQTLEGCEGCFSYLNNILVFSSMATQLNGRVRALLQCLSDKDFRLNVAKCQFAITNVPFLRHLISSTGIKPDPKSLDAIPNVRIPQSIIDIRSFLGSISWLHEFWPHLPDHAEPLQQLTVRLRKSSLNGVMNVQPHLTS